MAGALIIVYREMLEAGLIIGVVTAATRGVPGRGRWIALGAGLGVLGACLLAVFAGGISSLFHGSGQELMNAAILLLAVLMLGWHNVWMKTHGRELAADARKLSHAVATGDRGLAAIAAVVAFAVLREGSEVVLFLFSLLASKTESWQSVASGAAAGLLLGAATSVILYLGLLAIPLRHFFSATTALITLLAAGLAAQAIGFLQQGGYLETGSTPIWDTSAALPESGVAGRLLHTLVGYTDQPSAMQAIAYALTLVAIAGAMKIVSQTHERRLGAS